MHARYPTKQDAVTEICHLLDIPEIHVTRGSSIPKELFVAMAERFGLDPAPSMPQIGRTVATSAGLPWPNECWSEGSTVTITGLGTLVEAVQTLVAPAPADDAIGVDDARRRIVASIVSRQGQPRFRGALLRSYGATCAVTGTTEVAVLEACHIRPYRGAHTNSVTNGLLLRSDIHTLFDLNLLSIDPGPMTVWISDLIQEPAYRELDGRPLRLPSGDRDRPDAEALREHFEESTARE